MITTQIDTTDVWETAWQAVQCHKTQLAIYRKLADLQVFPRDVGRQAALDVEHEQDDQTELSPAEMETGANMLLAYRENANAMNWKSDTWPRTGGCSGDGIRLPPSGDEMASCG